MKTRISVLALIMAIMAVLSMAPAAEAQRRRTVDRSYADNSVSGTITDASSGAPVPSAEVTIQSVTRKANAAGQFTITDLTVGTWPVTVERWGYEPKTLEIQIESGTNTFNASLNLLPFVTVQRTDGTVERFATDTVTWGYVVPFTGTFAKPELEVCTGDPSAPLTLERGSIAVVSGPAERVETPCCAHAPGERITIQPKEGATFQAIVTASCAPNDIYFIARSLDTAKIGYVRLSEMTRIEFPE